MTNEPKRSAAKSGNPRRLEGLYAFQLCGDFNPDIRLFYVLAFARVVALAGYCLRTFTAMQRQELYDHQLLGLPYILLAPLLAAAYTVWLYFSTWPHIQRLAGSKKAVTDSIFDGKAILSQWWVASAIVVDLIFFSAFFLTTLKVESDLFVYFTLPILTASTFFESNVKRRLATVILFSANDRDLR